MTDSFDRPLAVSETSAVGSDKVRASGIMISVCCVIPAQMIEAFGYNSVLSTITFSIMLTFSVLVSVFINPFTGSMDEHFGQAYFGLSRRLSRFGDLPLENPSRRIQFGLRIQFWSTYVQFGQ